MRPIRAAGPLGRGGGARARGRGQLGVGRATEQSSGARAGRSTRTRASLNREVFFHERGGALVVGLDREDRGRGC